MAVQLAAPHTWPAAIMPIMLAIAFAIAGGHTVATPLALAVLGIGVLLQSAANTLNDYYDCVKETDDEDACVDPTDAVLVYNNVDPRAALRLAMGMVVAAFVLGAYVIFHAGLIPLGLGVVGAAFVVAYSAGRTPLSYLPLGEVVSGVVMGGIMPFAAYQALTLDLNGAVWLWCLPSMLLIGLIMLVNNTSDIERDTRAQRSTLAILLGRSRAVLLYRLVTVGSLALVCAIVAAWFPGGTVMLPFMVLAAIPLLQAMMRNPLTAERRLQSMPQVLNVNILIGAFYAVAVLIHASGLTVTAL
ncbi:prenyltransferase [Eggerthellaceae bacterium zg-1084]|nr:prenyltransferase [Berryella wangjianweii]NPD32582.1 prenyltransferase [Eggerthellaceae bacterium zg-997]